MVSAVSGSTNSPWALQQQGANGLADSIFSTVDTNNKGYIDKASLIDALAEDDMSSADIDELFAQVDQDNDGQITKNELSTSIDQLVQALAAQSTQSRVDGARAQAAGEERGFTKDEVSAIAADSQTETQMAALMSKIAENFAAADTDANGRVDAKEALAYDQAASTDASAVAGAAAAGGIGGPSNSTTYDVADTNEDGTVSLEELMAYQATQANKPSADATAPVTNADKENRNAMRMLVQLVQAYGQASDTSAFTSAETLSAYA